VTPKQFVEALDRVGFSQRGFARCIDTDERQVRRWVAGDERIPGSVARLLRLMIALGLTEKDINRAGRTIR
jgi:DNA-binding transcriptional regulator YiaG